MEINNEIPNIEFLLKTNAKFGVGIFKNLKSELEYLSYHKIGVILDPALSELDYLKDILKDLESDESMNVIKWIYDLKAEPDYDSLDRIKTKFIDTSSTPLIDCFIGIGGGSVIDFAKGLATLVVNQGDAINYRGFPENINPPLPVIAVPTTAGTGSEVTYNAVFTDKKGEKKLGINSKLNFPVLALLDPILTLGCPKSVTVSSGMDAVVHTLESHIANQSNQINRIFSREAFKILYNNLYHILDNMSNTDVRAQLQLGAYLASISLINSGSGPAGALSYSLGVHFNVPHGIAGAVFLPFIVEHNVKAGYDYGDLYDLIEGTEKNIDTKEKSIHFSEKIFELCNVLGVPDSLRVFGVDETNIQTLIDESENLQNAFAQNPVPFTVHDANSLLLRMIKEK